MRVISSPRKRIAATMLAATNRAPSIGCRSYYNSTSRSNPNKESEPTPLDRQSIIAELEAERDRLDSAIAALQGRQGSRTSTATGRPDGRRRRLSAAARKKIGQAMKKRWAERKRKEAA
ncbi:MAG TPA: hypothetical protein VIK39_16465 [Candidatus Angelobacter sp.]